MAEKIKVWVKEPMHKPKHVWVSARLENLQKIVDGRIENYALDPKVGILCNEEGALGDYYFNAEIEGCQFFGTIIFVGYKGEEFCSCPWEKEDIKSKYPWLWNEQ